MKTFKKTWMGIAALIFVTFICALFFLPSHRAFADNISDANLSQICVPPYTPAGKSDHHTVNGWLSVDFTDRAHLVGTYSANGSCASPADTDPSVFYGTSTFDQIFKNISGQSNTMFLTDNLADPTINYGEAVGSSGQDDTRIDQFSDDLDNLMKDPLGGYDKMVNANTLKQKLTSTEITLGLETDDVGYGCGDSSWKNENFVLVDGNPPQWKCVDSTDISGEKGFLVGADNYTNLDNFNITYTVTTDSNGNTIIQSVYNNEQANRTFTWCPGPGKFLNKGCNGSDLELHASQSDIQNLGSSTGQFSISKIDGSSSFPVIVAGSGSAAATPPGSTPPGGGGATSSCDANFNSAFSWAICPMLSFADGAIGFFYNQVENQLCFNTGASSTAGDFTCGNTKDTSLDDGVKEAWSIFKNIASALLVIVMLVMVISQAIGGGPFDAYTIRKMLPKLVAAVIIMQLSWILLKFAIDLSNDAGATIGNLMMAPFGGPGHMDLGSMLGRAIDTATGSQPGNTIDMGQTTFVLFSGVAAIGLFVWAIPALPLMALYVFAGAFIAFFTLILRKLLIIILVILAPLAFIAWLLPGTEKYWKLWSDNFSKILMMFPLIMAMLSGGRIFAYITSISGNASSMFNPHLAVAHLGFLPIPYVASATGFVNIIVVLVAFFAPYFFLPKTYTWGGQLMGQVGKAVENYTNKGAEPAKKLLKEREESYRAERRRKSAIRVSKNESFNILKPWQKPVDSLRSGQWDPTLGLPGSRRRQSAVTKYVAQGAESEQQEVKEADLRLDVLFQQVDDHDGLARAYANGGKDENGNDYVYTTHDGRQHKLGNVSEAEMQAGLNAVAKFGGSKNFRFLDRRVAEMREGSNAEHKRVAKSFLDANSSTLIGKMKHFYYGPERDGAVSAMVGSMSENSFVGMEGSEMEAILESLTQRIANGDAAATPELQRVLTFYQSALDNDNIRPNISSGVNQAVKALADATVRNDINIDPDPATGAPRGRVRWGLDGIEAATPGAPAGAGAVGGLVTTLDGRIDQFGNVT